MSVFVRSHEDPCLYATTCQSCITTRSGILSSFPKNETCVWQITHSGEHCASSFQPTAGVSNVAFNLAECKILARGSSETSTGNISSVD
ncbi:unnamed protein product [Orchesella dallaii]